MHGHPPLRAIIAFDAAMREGSFQQAAVALSITPGAVGQQVRKLEDWLGVALFVRRVREIRPTAEALAYWKDVQPALAHIAGASLRLKGWRSMAVDLSMPPSFAAKWFPQRLARLLTQHPTLELRMSASSALVDFERERTDLAVRYFGGEDPALESSLLCRDEIRLYCSPEYAGRLQLDGPQDVARATLLATTLHPHWPAWFRAHGQLDEPAVAALPRLQFDQSLIAIEAARRSQGVVLTSPLLVEDEIATGQLIQPFQSRLPVSSGYYIVHPRRWPLRPAAATVRAWFLDETRPLREP